MYFYRIEAVAVDGDEEDADGEISRTRAKVQQPKSKERREGYCACRQLIIGAGLREANSSEELCALLRQGRIDVHTGAKLESGCS